MVAGGKKTWYFADGYLPEKSTRGSMEAHEALMIFNTHEKNAEALIDIYYSDRPPVRDIRVNVPAERIIALRMDHPEDLAGNTIPEQTQYALRIRASAPVVVQFGRLDTKQNNMAYYVGVGYSE